MSRSKPTHSPRPVTIREVAREAGVSTSTVSRVLNSNRSSQNANAARVREAAERLGYIPDIYASGLRRVDSQTIGVLVPRLTDYVMAALFEEITRACHRHGYFAIVATSGDDVEAMYQASDTLLKRRVDGLILTTARSDDQFTQRLRERDVPHALAIRTDDKSPSAIGDDQLGGYLAARHLIDLGHRDIAILAGPAYASSATRRLAGFREGMLEAGLEVPEHNICASEFSMSSGEERGALLLQRKRRPTAVFAVNDHLALGLISAAYRLGLRVPDDLSVVGYNDIPQASLLPVALTTLRTPFEQIASDALDLLLTGQGGAAIRMTPPSLIPRNSTRRLE